MNEAFVNPPTAFLPSYDYGAALEFATGDLGANAVLMNVGENDDGRGYWFWGMQLGYQLSTSWGDGNYRLLIDGTSKDFLDPKGLNEEALLGLTFSIDQELGETIGAFARIGWQQDDAAVDYSAVYSGGLNIGGTLWGPVSG